MKRTRTVMAALLMLSMPMAACANIWIPSFAQCLTSPLASSLSGFGLFIAVPAILVVSLVEALVLRRHAKGLPLSKAVRFLVLINAITSILGAVMMPLGTELWPGLPICFVLTVIAEGLMLLACAAKLRLPPTLQSAFVVSAKINAASYALLVLTFAVFVYLPQIANESPALRSSVSGKLAIVRGGNDIRLLDLSCLPPRLLREAELELLVGPLEPQGNRITDYQIGRGGRIFGLMSGRIVELRYTGHGWRKRFTRLPAGLSDPVGLSTDGRLICGRLKGRLTIYDLSLRRAVLDVERYTKKAGQPNEWYTLLSNDAVCSFDNRYVAVRSSYEVHSGTGHTTYRSESRLIDLKSASVVQLEDAWSLAFSPTVDQLAWEVDDNIIVLDCATGRRQKIRVPGRIASALAWSPDGQFIAYLGHPNWFTSQNWRPDTRVVDVRTSKSATLRHDVWTAGCRCSLYWLE